MLACKGQVEGDLGSIYGKSKSVERQQTAGAFDLSTYIRMSVGAEIQVHQICLANLNQATTYLSAYRAGTVALLGFDCPLGHQGAGGVAPVVISRGMALPRRSVPQFPQAVGHFSAALFAGLTTRWNASPSHSTRNQSIHGNRHTSTLDIVRITPTSPDFLTHLGIFFTGLPNIPH